LYLYPAPKSTSRYGPQPSPWQTKTFSLFSGLLLADTVRRPQWSRQLVPKPQSGDIKRPVAQTSSGPRYNACNGAIRAETATGLSNANWTLNAVHVHSLLYVHWSFLPLHHGFCVNGRNLIHRALECTKYLRQSISLLATDEVICRSVPPSIIFCCYCLLVFLKNATVSVNSSKIANLKKKLKVKNSQTMLIVSSQIHWLY